MAHNRYQQPGGEDEATASDTQLLRAHGHEVVEYTEDNDRITRMSALRVVPRTIWSGETYSRVRSLIRQARPDVVHVQNFFPLISPSIYYAARTEGVPVVQTLHNYRLICPGSLLLRDGKICENCIGQRVPLSAVRHGCYRGSRSATAAVAGMLSTHHALRTWTRAVDVYIALTAFGRAKFVAGGIPPEKIVVKPNSVDPDPGFADVPGAYHLYVGRLSEEKGVMTLLQAWTQLHDLPLRIAGDGPLARPVRRFIDDHALTNSVRMLGHVSRDQLLQLVREARSVIVPSICYETFGLSAIEAFACGTPVVASNIGALGENVRHGVEGVLFEPGNAAQLAAAVRSLESDPETHTVMRRAARTAYESLYAGERVYQLLLDIYGMALARFRTPRGKAEALAHNGGAGTLVP